MTARIPLAWPLSALAAFAVLLPLAAGGWAPLDRFDAEVIATARRYGTGHRDLITFARMATTLGATVVFVLAGVVATGVLALRRSRPAAVFCASVTVVVPVSWAVLHVVLYRPRPLDGFVVVTSNGFPSGHSANAAAAALVAVLLLRRAPGPWRWVVPLLAGGCAAGIGLTRVILLAHWPSDVLGGWLLAVGLVTLLARAAEHTAGSPWPDGRRRAGGAATGRRPPGPRQPPTGPDAWHRRVAGGPATRAGTAAPVPAGSR